ncbi:unnamed protein product [Leptidea sinapis]|uniref:Uncharacterized protein n=1 Tax=Leptidea sinapis TaxID=189913 RepID=A0A5E4Q7N7_9NEOP|nr:unnamed protein product [Leptidea sinapis]
MSNSNLKVMNDLKVEHLPVKKMKMEVNEPLTRTVATMCGAWRPDEVDGGLIFVFKERVEALSPNPGQESDFPENIEDFWEASFCDGVTIKSATDLPDVAFAINN